ncbi:hypothetical protein [Sphaerotilus hippei]|nr:hypothetical protein [Sphaerotilus hippei]
MQAYLIENEGILNLDHEIFCDAEIIEIESHIDGGGANDNNGRIDIVAIYSQEYIAVIELKNSELNNEHLKQLEGYLARGTDILNRYPTVNSNEGTANKKLIGVLVGTSITEDLRSKLQKGYTYQKNNSTIPVAALTIQRFRSENGNVYATTNTHFKNQQANANDTTQYSLDGTRYGKGKLALAIIKKYVENNSPMTLEGLRQQFPRTTVGSYDIAAPTAEATEIYNNTRRKKHFLNQDQIIQLQGGPVAVCNQWGIGNIGRIIEIARKLGYVINP